MENITELEQKIQEEVEEAIEGRKTLDEIRKAVGQTTLSLWLKGVIRQEKVRRRFFDLRKLRRNSDEEPK